MTSVQNLLYRATEDDIIQVYHTKLCSQQSAVMVDGKQKRRGPPDELCILSPPKRKEKMVLSTRIAKG